MTDVGINFAGNASIRSMSSRMPLDSPGRSSGSVTGPSLPRSQSPSPVRCRRPSSALRAVGVDLDLDEMMPGRSSRETSTIVDTGRMSANTSPCAAPTASQSAMSRTKIRDRTTWSNVAPALANASPMIRSDHPGLFAGVALADHLTIDRRGRAGDVHVVAAANHPAVADDALPRPTGTPTLDPLRPWLQHCTGRARRDQRSTSSDLTPIER